MNKDQTLDYVILAAGGGSLHSAIALCGLWGKSGYRVRLTNFSIKPVPPIEGVQIIEPLANRQSVSGLKKFITMLLWYITIKPQYLFVNGLSLATMLTFIRIVCFWQKSKIAVFIDTHISDNLHFRQSQTSGFLRVLKTKITHNLIFYKISLSFCASFVCLLPSIRDDLIYDFNLSPDRAFVIPPLVNSKYFDGEVTTHRLKKRILYIGRLSEEKAVSDIILATAKLYQSDRNVKLMIVGDGPERKKLERLAQNKLPKKAYEFVGQQSDLIAYQHNATCQVLSSHYEGFPLVMIESMAQGVPFVGYEKAVGYNSVIEDGVNGYRVEQGDQKELANKISKALSLNWNPDVIRKTAMAYHPDKVSKLYLDFIRQF